MAKVKFIQLGSDNLPKSEYQSKLTKAREDYPGAIIFGTYFDPDTQSTAQEIWANDKKYSVGGGGSGANVNLYDGSLDVSTWWAGKSEAEKATFYNGDYYVRKESDSSVESPNDGSIYNRTAYVFIIPTGQTAASGGRWEALNGNVNADNVYFPQGVQRNRAWGWTKEQTDCSTECIGSNLKDLIQYYLVESAAVIEATKEELYQGFDAITFKDTFVPTTTLTVYDGSLSSSNVVSSGTWQPVGTKLYIPANVDVIYQNYNPTTEDVTDFNDASVYSQAKITTSVYGYWSKEDDITRKKAGVVKKDDGVTPKTEAYGTKDERAVVFDGSYTEGNISLKLTSGNLGYTTVAAYDEQTSSTPKTDTSLNLKRTDTYREFTVQECSNSGLSDYGYITLTATNESKWYAHVPALDASSLTIWGANNMYDKNKAFTKDPSAHDAVDRSVTVDSPDATFTVYGYYPIYSNYKRQGSPTGKGVYDSSLCDDVTNTDKTDYTFSFKTLWSKGTTSNPNKLYFEIPTAKKVSKITMGGTEQDLSMVIEEDAVSFHDNYTRFHSTDSLAYAMGAEIVITLVNE